MTFAQPVTIMPNTTYVASYFAPNGHYAGDDGLLLPGSAPPQAGGARLHSARRCRRSTTTRAPNGVFTYSTTSTFPTNTFGATNYWVDPVFMPVAGARPGHQRDGDGRL